MRLWVLSVLGGLFWYLNRERELLPHSCQLKVKVQVPFSASFDTLRRERCLVSSEQSWDFRIPNRPHVTTPSWERRTPLLLPPSYPPLTQWRAHRIVVKAPGLLIVSSDTIPGQVGVKVQDTHMISTNIMWGRVLLPPFRDESWLPAHRPLIPLGWGAPHDSWARVRIKALDLALAKRDRMELWFCGE